MLNDEGHRYVQRTDFKIAILSNNNYLFYSGHGKISNVRSKLYLSIIAILVQYSPVISFTALCQLPSIVG